MRRLDIFSFRSSWLLCFWKQACIFSLWTFDVTPLSGLIMYLTRTNMQELFEAVFNYFPITFRPPPDDPYGISAQQLKNRLCECIAANGAFAPFAFPALLDKLDSTALNTKVNQCSMYWN